MPSSRFEIKRARSIIGQTITNILGDGRVTITDNGIQAVQGYLVENIKATSTSIYYFATLAPGIPQHGTAHPDIPGIWVSSIVGSPVTSSPTKASVIVTWGAPTATGGGINDFGNNPEDTTPTLEVSTTLQTVSTNIDANGDSIFVEYTPSIPFIDAGNTKTQGGMVEIQIPLTTLTYRRREFIETTVGGGPPIGISTKAQRFTGKLNSTGIFNSGIRSWICSNLNAISDDGQNTMNVTYEFIKAPQRLDSQEETWDATIVYIDPDTGKPPFDATPGNTNVSPPLPANGVKTGIRVYRTDDFTLLQLGNL